MKNLGLSLVALFVVACTSGGASDKANKAGEITTERIVKVGCEIPKPSKIISISVNQQRGCALTDTGIQCWGKGIGWAPWGTPCGLKNPRSVVVTSRQACAITDNGVQCWSGFDEKYSGPPKGLEKATSLVGHDGGEICAINNGKPNCWTSGIFDMPNPFEENVRSIAIHRYAYCVIKNDGSYNCKGTPNYADTWAPVKYVPKDLEKPTQFSLNYEGGCAIVEKDRVRCWRSSDTLKDIENVPDDLAPAKEIAVGRGAACAITTSGIRCWGKKDEFHMTEYPDGLVEPRSLVTEGASFCVTHSKGIACWGAGPHLMSQLRSLPIDFKFGIDSNQLCGVVMGRARCLEYGRENLELADGINSQLSNDETFTDVQTAFIGVFGLTNRGNVRIKMNKYASVTTDFPVSGLSGVKQMVVEGYALCAVFENKTVNCWITVNSDLAVPKSLPPVERVTIQNSSTTACAWHTNGRVTCWGNNEKQKADIASQKLYQPVDIISLQGSICGLMNGRVSCYGDNENPKLFESLTNVERLISSSQYSACALVPGKIICGDGRPSTSVEYSTESSGKIYNLVDQKEQLCAATEKEGFRCFRGDSYWERSQFRIPPAIASLPNN